MLDDFAANCPKCTRGLSEQNVYSDQNRMKKPAKPSMFSRALLRLSASVR